MFLLDAIPHCGTSGCAKVINHAIKHDLVTGERGNMFLSGLALVNSPSEEMIGHVLSLCEAKPSRTAMLTLGTLIHKLCEDGRCDSLVSSRNIEFYNSISRVNLHCSCFQKIYKNYVELKSRDKF